MITHFPGNRGSPPSFSFYFPPLHTPEDKMDKMDYRLRLIVQDKQENYWSPLLDFSQLQRCLSIAKGFDVLLHYDSPLRFPSKLKSSGAASAISITSRTPPITTNNCSRHKFVRQAIAAISAPAATSVYADLMILARNVPGLARGKANAWRIARGKPGGNALVVPLFSTSLWRNSASSMH